MRFHMQDSAQGVHSLRRASQPKVFLPYKVDPVRRDLKTFAIIGNLKVHFLRIKRKADVHLRRLSMSYHVGQRLLQNAKQCQTYIIRQALTVVRQREMELDIRVLFLDIISMRTDGVLKTETKNSWGS